MAKQLGLGEAVLELKTTLDGYLVEMKKAKGAAENLDKKFKKISKNLQSFGKNMANVGKKLTMFVSLPLAALGAIALKNAADFEKQRVAFETLLGSVDKAQTLLQQLEDFSAATPFQLPGLIEGSKRLLAFGIAAEDIVGTMTNLGNAAMGDQQILDRLTLAFGKVRAKGKASMEELNMFTEAGVGIMEALAEQYDVTTEKLFEYVSQGKVGFEEVNQALIDMTTGQGQFAGMIEKQSETLSGMFSTLKDNIRLLLTDMGNAWLPLVKEIVHWLTEWVKVFRGLDARTKKIITIIGLLVIAIFPLILIVGKLTAAFAALALALNINPIFLAISAIAALAIGITALVVIMNKQKKLQEETNALLDDQKKTVEETTTSLKELREEYDNLTLAQKIAKTETLLATQELMLQEAIVKKDKWIIDSLTRAVNDTKRALKELTGGVEKDKDEWVLLADKIKNDVTIAFRNAEREAEVFGDKTGLAAEKIQILENAIKDAIEHSFLPESQIIKWLAKQLSEYTDALEAAAFVQEKFSESMEFVKGKRDEWEELKKIYEDAYKVLNRLRMDDLGREIASIDDMRLMFIDAGINRIEVEEWAQKEIDKIREKYDKKEKESQRDLALGRLATMQDLFSRLSGIVSQFAQFEETTLENEYEDRRQHIEDTIENEQEKESALAELDEEMEARRKGMQQDQARRSKLIAIFEAIVNTASAVIEALPNIALATAIGVLGGIQGALIAATPIPQFAAGADFLVPPGYPNDSYLMAAQSGEHVSITPKDKGSRVVVFDIHDFEVFGPGGMREFARNLRAEFDSLDVLGI